MQQDAVVDAVEISMLILLILLIVESRLSPQSKAWR